jgi:hypothetical protein
MVEVANGRLTMESSFLPPLKKRKGGALTRFGEWLGCLSIFCFFVWWFATLFAASASQAPHPQPELGRTFHLDVTVGRHGLSYDGYVKPWVGHMYHFVMTVGTILLAGFVLTAIILLAARKLNGEPLSGSDGPDAV